MANFEITKHLQLSIHHPEKLCKVSHALSTPLRVGILQQLTGQSLRVNELAKALDQPMSTIALNVRILEEAGLITSELRNGPRGASKLCSRCVDRVDITLFTPIRVPPSTNELIIPLPIVKWGVPAALWEKTALSVWRMIPAPSIFRNGLPLSISGFGPAIWNIVSL